MSLQLFALYCVVLHMPFPSIFTKACEVGQGGSHDHYVIVIVDINTVSSFLWIRKLRLRED